MPRSRRRPFTLADSMIVIGFTAAGLGMARYVLDVMILTWRYTYLMVGAPPILACWTLAHLSLRLRGLRPSLRRSSRQPGVAASLAALPTVVIWAGIIGVGWFRGDTLRALNRFSFIGVGGGASVLGAWLLLFLAGAGRCERGWVDRSGQALGIAWIALMLLILYHKVI